MLVYLCRHGRTHLNAEGRVRGLEDPPLDTAGRAEAAALGQHFSSVPIEAVASTPLQRARATAAAIAEPHGLTVRVAAELLDRDYGPWAGQPTADVLTQFGSIDAAPGVEPWDAFRARVQAGFDRVLVDADVAVIAVVAHDAVNRALLQALCDLDPLHIPQATGCWNELERSDGPWRLIALDRRPEPVS